MLRLSYASLRSYATLLGALGVLSCGDAPTAPRNVESAVATTATPANITAPSLVISQIYGAGGNSGALVNSDFIEIFNPGTSAVSLTGWSVQYASSTGTSWQVTPLSGSIAAGGYYLVKESGGSVGAALPTPDATGTILMAADKGKVALLSSTTAIASGTSCPSGGALVDFVPYGSANCPNPTGTTNTSLAAFRGSGGCTYTGVASADFSLLTVAPRNSASPKNACSAPPAVPASVTVAPTSISIVAGNTTTFTPTALDASSNPVSTTYTWASSDVTVATINAAGTATGVAAGTTTITVTTANNLSATAQLTVTAPTLTSHAGEIVISQINGGGGNANATFKNDYIELFNRTTQPVVVDGWSVQYASATGAFSQATLLTGTIPAGGYYLVAQSSGGANGADLPAAQATGAILMSANAGKVLLFQGTTPAGVTCPTGNAVVDQVSYGTGTNCGTATPTLSSTLAALRKSGGCYYTPDAATDFTTGTPAPRNAATTPRSCVVGPLDHVTISGGATVLVGATTQLTAVALDANDNIVPGATFTWTSANTSLATVNATGLVSGVSANIDPATITVSATANGITKTASVNVQVNTDGINWIDVSSSSTSFPPGFQTQIFFTARVQQNGTIIPADFTFEAVEPQYMTVQNRNNTAIVTGVSAPTDGTRPGIKVTAVPKGGGTPYTFVSRTITIEPSVVSPPSIYANNDEFGLPTPATTSSTTDMLIRRPEMTIAYNQDRGTPNWVSYELDARHLVTGADRCNCFTADPLLPPNKQIFTSDYTNGGYDRGHMARSADRTSSNYENATTFYLTNIVPQLKDLNQGVWAQFENQLADSARAGRAVYIITGPLYSRSNVLRYVNDSGKIAIPDSTWKVALIGPGNGGNPFTRANITSWDDLTGLTLLAVNMPNIAGVQNDPPSKYYTTVEKIEAATGYDFLSLLNAAYQPALDYKDHAPVARFTTSGGTVAGSPITFDASTSSDSDIGRTDLGRTESLRYSWNFSDGSTATGVTVTKSFALNGNVTATLTVTDAFGWPSTTSAAVTLANVAPQAMFAAPTTTAEGTAFTLQLNNATDPSPADQAALRYAFDCGAGYGELSTSSSANCTRADNGVVTVRAKVVDPQDAFTEYTATVTITNVAPTAVLNAPPAVSRGAMITLSLTGATDVSSADVAAGFTFAFDCGTGYGAASPAATALCPALSSGALTVHARITDKDGGSTDYTAIVQVTPVPPTATMVAPATGVEGTPFTISLTAPTAATEAELGLLKYAFDCGAGFGALATTSSASCTPADNGTQTVRAKVVDSEGAFTEYTATVAVSNVAPTASFVAPSTAARGSNVSLAFANVVDPSTADVSAGFTYSYDCGTGFGAATSSATGNCTPASSGTLTVRGRISDKDGGSTEYTATITVTPVAPTATFVSPAAVNEGSAIALSLAGARGAVPAELPLLRYAFDCGAGYSTLGSVNNASCPTTDNGARTVRAKLVDSEGASTEYTATVTILNVAPTATFAAPASVERGFAFAVNFANATDVSTSDVAAGFTYAFDCGTGYGAASTNVATTCGFTTTGTKTVRGRVIDKDGGATEYSAAVNVTSPILALVRRAPVLNGRIEGNVQQLTGENVTFSSGGAITGRLYMPGLPTVRLNGNPTFGGSVDGIGSTSPAGYTVTLNGNATLGGLARRFDAVSLSSVDAPRNTIGTRTVALNKATDVVGDWATVKTLTVNGNVGTVAVPAGVYEEIAVNGNNTLVLGVAGSTTPAEYDLKRLTLDGNATLQVAGPVILTMSDDLQLSGSVGSASRPDLLTLRFSQGNLTLNGNATLNAVVVTPNGRVTINGGTMIGALVADGLALNGNAVLKIVASVLIP